MEIIEEWENISFEKILKLYESVGWSAYTKYPESLKRAFKNSNYVLVGMEGETVVGITRSISDEVSIHYLQDILIHPNFQKRGLGRKLLSKVLENFEDVRTHMILTDDEEKQKLFYESLGYKNTKTLEKTCLNTFIKIKGVELG